MIYRTVTYLNFKKEHGYDYDTYGCATLIQYIEADSESEALEKGMEQANNRWQMQISGYID